MDVRDTIYVGGAWIPSTGTETIDVVNATTEEVMGRIPQGTPEDVDKAVAAAGQAFPEWAQTSVDDRAKYLQRIAEGLQARMEPLATLISQEMGMPLRLSQMIQVGLPMTTFMSMSQVLQEV
ncbi:MAG TPA: aldehyde dehydrogenase family protein, partial [Actinomycetota bacterium]|nr:aldehyde dehydrogenase family protein [Actinomycetota bacterium]